MPWCLLLCGKRLLPLLDFGREREGVDLSKVVLTHHRLKEQGQRSLALHDTDGDYKLQPLTDTGAGVRSSCANSWTRSSSSSQRNCSSGG